MDLYEIEVKNISNNSVKLSDYKNKTLLIVNTATGCGFTPQYEGLEIIYKKYKDQGFEILDFPCDQFGHQAPGSDEEINTFCTLTYNTTFPRFAKVEVNGTNESPLFSFLKKSNKGILGADIKWNFTKFLVDKNGKVIKRYAPIDKPDKIEKDIAKLFNN